MLIKVDTESLARYRDANLLVLRALADSRAFGANWTSARVTVCLIEMREEIKYNLDAVDILIRSGLVALYDYDKHLAQVLIFINTRPVDLKIRHSMIETF